MFLFYLPLYIGQDVSVNMCACETRNLHSAKVWALASNSDKPQTAFSIPLLELFVCHWSVKEVNQFASVSLKSCL